MAWKKLGMEYAGHGIDMPRHGSTPCTSLVFIVNAVVIFVVRTLDQIEK